MIVHKKRVTNVDTDTLLSAIKDLVFTQQEDCPQLVAEGYANRKYVLTIVASIDPVTEIRSLNAELELMRP